MRISIIVQRLLSFICKYIPLFIVIALVGLVLLLTVSNRLDVLIRIFPFIATSLLVALFLFINRFSIGVVDVEQIDTVYSTTISTNTIHRYLKIYVIVFVLTVASLICFQEQNQVFFLLVFLLYSVSVFQIFSKTGFNAKHVVIQLFLTSLLVTGAQLICHPYFYGVDDIFPHTRWASGILETGATLSSDFGGQYTYYPLLHIGIAVTTMLSGIDIYLSPYIVMLIPVLTSVIFVYYIARYFTKSNRIAAAASFFYLMIPVVLRYATSTMTFVIATFGFLLIVYILSKITNGQRITNLMWVIVSTIITLYMTFVHHATVVVVFAGMFILLLSSIIYGKKLNKPLIITTVIFFVIQGVYFARHYLSNIISIVFSRLDNANPIINPSETPSTILPETPSTILPETPGTTTTLVETVDELLIHNTGVFPSLISYLVLGLLTGIVLIGIYYIGKQNDATKRYSVLLPFLMIFLPVFVWGMIELLGINYEGFRFRLMIAPFYAIALGIGCFVVYETLSKNNRRKLISKAVVCTFCLGLVVCSPLYMTSTDASLYSNTENEEVNYFTDNDLVLLQYVETYIPSESKIMSDHIIYRYYSSTSASVYGVPDYRIQDTIYRLYMGDYESDESIKYTLFRYNLYKRDQLEIVVPERGNTVIAPSEKINEYIAANTALKSLVYESGYNVMYWC